MSDRQQPRLTRAAPERTPAPRPAGGTQPERRVRALGRRRHSPLCDAAAPQHQRQRRQRRLALRSARSLTAETCGSRGVPHHRYHRAAFTQLSTGPGAPPTAAAAGP